MERNFPSILKPLWKGILDTDSWIMQTQSQGTITRGSFSLVSYLTSRKYRLFGNSIWYFEQGPLQPQCEVRITLTTCTCEHVLSIFTDHPTANSFGMDNTRWYTGCSVAPTKYQAIRDGWRQSKDRANSEEVEGSSQLHTRHMQNKWKTVLQSKNFTSYLLQIIQTLSLSWKLT